MGGASGSTAQASISPEERAGVVQTYRIPAGSVASALNTFADVNGLQMVYDSQVTQDLKTSGLRGAFSLKAGLDRLLSGTGLSYRFINKHRAVSIELAQADMGTRYDASDPETLPPIDISATPVARTTEKKVSAPSENIVSGEELRSQQAAAVDTADLLKQVPGVSLYTGGGVSNLPVIHGLADDRINILLDGVNVTSACSNHMNPPLSYIDPSRVGKIEVLSGVTPVSKGGDSIGGSIIVEPAAPEFAKPGEYLTSGRVGTFWRSNSDNVGVNLSARTATDKFYADYSFAFTKARSYRRGTGGSPWDATLWEYDRANNYLRFLGDGAPLDGSLYEATRHAARLAFKTDNGVLSFDVSGQHIPYQGFPNQPMDMTLNNSIQGGARYQGAFDWGNLDARVYYQRTNHEMDNLVERTRNPNSRMPMKDVGVDFGYHVKAEIPVADRHLLRIGNEYHQFRLEDWYPGVTQWFQLPHDFISIHAGRRERVGTYAELHTNWSDEWSTLVGVRNDVVWMNTGQVNGYRNDAGDRAYSDPFNLANRSRTDVNFDATASVRYAPTNWSAYELGFSRKTRSPNLYERYAWWDHNGMIGWAGDGNGYAGNLDLKPEVAYQAGFSAEWRDPLGDDWFVKISPYYTYIDQYIWGRAEDIMSSGFRGLQFVNIDHAELYGVDLSGRYAFLKNTPIGDFALRGNLNYVRGTYYDGGRGRPCPVDNLYGGGWLCGALGWPLAGLQGQTSGSLYHIMPLNGRIALDHSFGNFTSALELQMVDTKSLISVNHGEPKTPGYALLNLRAGYKFENFRIDAGIDNIFDKLYYPPLGGIALDETYRPWVWGTPAIKRLIPGMGRSVWAGASVEF